MDSQLTDGSSFFSHTQQDTSSSSGSSTRQIHYLLAANYSSLPTYELRGRRERNELLLTLFVSHSEEKKTKSNY